MSKTVAQVTEAEGAVGVLISNAGYSQSGAVESVPLENVRGQAPQAPLRGHAQRAHAHRAAPLTPDRVWDVMMRAQFPTPRS
jgi:NAD(P)-dependent dehydrogenase (short-subunit alcohol dehydrogenase family)